MASPVYDRAFVDELIDDVEAYMHRSNVLTDFAESQVEERIRLARVVNELQLKISDLAQQIEALDARLRPLDRSITVRLTRAPRRIWRTVRRSPPR
jgi:phage shock protein A